VKPPQEGIQSPQHKEHPKHEKKQSPQIEVRPPQERKRQQVDKPRK
jgi:hypothetical protein